MKDLKFIITGFGQFGYIKENPSEILVNNIND